MVPMRPQGSLAPSLSDHVVAEDRTFARRIDPARLNRVDIDVVPGQLDGDRAAQMVKSRLPGVVGARFWRRGPGRARSK